MLKVCFMLNPKVCLQECLINQPNAVDQERFQFLVCLKIDDPKKNDGLSWFIIISPGFKSSLRIPFLFKTWTGCVDRSQRTGEPLINVAPTRDRSPCLRTLLPKLFGKILVGGWNLQNCNVDRKTDEKLFIITGVPWKCLELNLKWTHCLGIYRGYVCSANYKSLTYVTLAAKSSHTNIKNHPESCQKSWEVHFYNQKKRSKTATAPPFIQLPAGFQAGSWVRRSS